MAAYHCGPPAPTFTATRLGTAAASAPMAAGASTVLACGGLYNTSGTSPAIPAMVSSAATASRVVSGSQSGRITWIASGRCRTAAAIRRAATRALMWPAPSWKGRPAARHRPATAALIRSHSSSSSSWNSPAVPCA
jgi:hypothetical protein